MAKQRLAAGTKRLLEFAWAHPRMRSAIKKQFNVTTLEELFEYVVAHLGDIEKIVQMVLSIIAMFSK